MFTSKRNRLAALCAAVVVMAAASLLAACGPRPVLIPIPVSTNGEPIVIVLATPTQAAAQAGDEDDDEADVADEAASGEDEETAAGASEEVSAGEGEEIAALIIPHKFRSREECTECHEADEGRHASPPDHVGYTDDLCVYCHEPEEDNIAMTPLPEDADTEFCLACHSPYEELMATTEELVVAFDGETANPHMYVPHDSDKIVSCKNCHDVHILPVMAPQEIPQADGNYCFAACHHEETFEPCVNCHDEGSGE